MGQSPPSSTYNTNGEGLPFLQGKAEFGDIYPTPVKWCSQPQKVANRGSVLISVRAPVGDVNVAQDKYCIGRGLAAINGGESLDNWFVFYWLIFAKQRLEDMGTGSTFKSINRGVLEKFPIPLPPLPEQRRIAHVLSTIQRAIAAQDALIAAARQLKRSLMRHLFTYGPVPLNQADQVPLKETEIGPVPEHWEVVRLGEVVEDSFSGGTPSTKRPEYWNGNIPWTTSAIIGGDDVILSRFQRTITELGLERSASKIAPRGSLMVGTRVGVGKAVVPDFDIAMSQDLTALVLRAHANVLFLAYLFKSIPLQRQIQGRTRGTTIKGIPRKDLLTLLIPLPPITEQHEIASSLSTVDRKIEAEEQRKAALQAVFKTMLQQLMTGRLRV